ncbi:MAG: hypothetical protein EP329_12785 [Deltaproteobacteria bacterium]|nr:MAG: hypothetical protein EP329_12785 [Deltaproteobacteria bacterium]
MRIDFKALAAWGVVGVLATVGAACTGAPAAGVADAAAAVDSGGEDAGADTAASVADAAPTDGAVGDVAAEDTGAEDTREVDTVEHDTVDADSAAPDTAEPPPVAFPEAELLLRILTPGGHGTASVSGSVTRLGGVLFGGADSVTWDLGSQGGAVEAGTFWETGPIALAEGDNVVTVTARRGAEVATDRVVVTYAPGFRFERGLRARPRAVWVGEPTQVVFTLSEALLADGQSVVLARADASGVVVEPVGAMVDDGETDASGDELGGDGVRTRRVAITCDGPGPRYFRAGVAAAWASDTAWSPLVRVDCLEHLTVEDCEAHRAVLAAAEQALADGDDVASVVEVLRQAPSVEAAGASPGASGGVWLQFRDGVLGALLNGPAGTRGAGGDEPVAWAESVPRVQSRRASVLAPFLSELGATDDGPRVVAALEEASCAVFAPPEGVLANAGASLAAFRGLSERGLVSVSTHGDALFGGLESSGGAERYGWHHDGAQEVLWTGSPVRCERLVQEPYACTVAPGASSGDCPSGLRCEVTAGELGGGGAGVCVDDTQADLRRGRVVMTNRGYAVTPAFFERYRGEGYPNSLVNLGACRSFYNGSLASELYASGARAVTGFTGVVDSAWARDRVVALFTGLTEGGAVGRGYSAAEDPHHPGTWWRLFGARDLDASGFGVVNGDFEAGALAGWAGEGDRRGVSRFAGSTPPGGKRMGLVSTGLGFTDESGALSQRFCIPPGTVQVSFYWRFISSEFLRWCGTNYQDRFTVVLEGEEERVTLVDARVDDLCPPFAGECAACPALEMACDLVCMGEPGCEATAARDGASCVGTYPCMCGRFYVGLDAATATGLGPDGAGFQTPWIHAVKSVARLAGQGPVTLRVFVTDIGDQVYDTAVLIDDLELR